MFLYFWFLLIYMYRASLAISVASKGILPLDINSVAIQFYMQIKNKNRVPCEVRTKGKRCCFSEEDCESMFVYGRHEEKIMPGDWKTLIFIYPSVFHHDKEGTCYFAVNYKYSGSRTRRKLIDVAFDTRLAKGQKLREIKRYIGHKPITSCDSVDENSLDDCSRVDCQLKYSDEKTFYDAKANKCVKPVTCVGKIKDGLPTLAYLPTVNFCRDLEHPVQIQDIFALSNGMSVVTESPTNITECVAMIETNCSTISEKLGLLEDILMGKMYPKQKGKVKVDYTNTCKNTILSILGIIFCICMCIFAVMCCIHTLIWCRKKWHTGEFDDACRSVRQKMGRKSPRSKASSPGDIKEKLLHDVIVRDIPLELRASVIDVCDRIGKEVRWKKRYRVADTECPLLSKEGSISGISSTDSLRANVTSEDEKLFQ